jgi:hypothetical protein
LNENRSSAEIELPASGVQGGCALMICRGVRFEAEKAQAIEGKDDLDEK